MIDKTDLFEKYKKLNITDPYNERLLFLSENEKFNKVVKKLREKFNIPLVGLKEESQQTFKEILFPKDKKHQGWRKEIEKELIQKLKIPLGKYKELFTRIVVWHYLYNDFYPLPKVLQESETGKIKPLPIAPVVSKLGDTIRVSFFIDYNTQKTKAKKFIQRYLDENWNKIGKIQKTISINNKRVVYQQSTKVPKDLKRKSKLRRKEKIILDIICARKRKIRESGIEILDYFADSGVYEKYCNYQPNSLYKIGEGCLRKIRSMFP